MNLKFRALKHFNYELPANQKEQCNMCNKYVNTLDKTIAEQYKALKKAKEALELSKIHTEPCFTTVHKKIDSAIAMIDKLIRETETT